MIAVLTDALVGSVTPRTVLPAPVANPGTDLAVVLVLAAGVTALLALVLVAVLLHRQARLTATGGRLSVTAALAIAGLTLVGILSLAPTAALAGTPDGLGSAPAERSGGPDASGSVESGFDDPGAIRLAH